MSDLDAWADNRRAKTTAERPIGTERREVGLVHRYGSHRPLANRETLVAELCRQAARTQQSGFQQAFKRSGCHREWKMR